MQTLQIELDTVSANQINEQNNYKNERQKIITDFELRLKQLQDIIKQLKEEKRLLVEESSFNEIQIKEFFMDKLEKINNQNNNLKEELNKLNDEICENNNQVNKQVIFLIEICYKILESRKE